MTIRKRIFLRVDLLQTSQPISMEEPVERGPHPVRTWQQMSFGEQFLRRGVPMTLLLAAALSSSLLLERVIPHAYLTLLLLATVASGWFGGRSFGILAGVISFACADFFFLPPVGTLRLAEDFHLAGVLIAVAFVGAGWLSGEWRKNRNELQESEEQYRVLLDGVRDHAVFLLDRDGNVATWNAGAQRIKGYTASDILGKPLSVFYTAEDREKSTPQELLRTAATKGTVHAEGWRVRKDGTRFWAEVVITTIFGENGHVRAYAKTTRDVTLLRQSSEALERKEQELRALVESTPDAVLMVNEEGAIIFANGRTEAMFGYGRKELLGKKVELLVPAAKRGMHVKQRENFQAEPHARPMGVGLELSAVRKDGSEFPVEISLGPVAAPGERRVVASVRDVSERRAMERDLQNSRIQELAQLMIRDLDGRILQWTAGMKRVYGYSRGEAEGAISHELLRTSFPKQLETIEADLLRTGFWEGELIHRKKDGARIFVNSYWVLHRDKEGRPWRVLESNSDVTALKEAEAKARVLNQELERQNADLTRAKTLIEAQTQSIAVAAKMSALGEMAGGMAHEINNPMGIIHARASDLMEFAEEKEAVPARMVVETMEKIRNTAARVTKITLGLRKFARETRNDPVVATPVQDIVEDTLSFCTQRLKQNTVELRVAPIEPTLRIGCRPTEISQVLLNLLNNSVDAVQSLPEKWVEVAVRDAGDELEIAVMDSGNGIPESMRARMGQPFFTTKEVGKGTGLGLSISRGIVEAHGGHLVLDTASPHTRFVVTLPKTAAARQEMAAAGRQAFS